MKIYVVVSIDGDYEDRHERAIVCYTTENEAQHLIEQAEVLVREYEEARPTNRFKKPPPDSEERLNEVRRRWFALGFFMPSHGEMTARSYPNIEIVADVCDRSFRIDECELIGELVKST